jgi:hypothetical protein
MIEVHNYGNVVDKSGKSQEFCLSGHIHSKRLETLRTTTNSALVVEYLQCQGNEFNRHIMAAGPWQCSAREQCSRFATGTVLTPMSQLNEDPPSVFQCLPILKCDDPLCEIAAKKIVAQYIDDATKGCDEHALKNDIKKRTYSGKGKLCECCWALDCDKTLMKCSRCKVVYYCSKDCQSRHWKEHRARCLPM